VDAIFKNVTGLEGKRIVVVEDDALLALDITEQLRAAGATVLGPAPTAHYAMQLIGPGKRRLDGAVLDIALHGKTVYELADVLIEREVPFLFATAQDRKAIPGRFQNAPVLNKPISPAKLAQTVIEMVRRPRPAPVALPVPQPTIEEPVKVFARVVARTLVTR
jgi:CheY-like chemotaxis protein